MSKYKFNLSNASVLDFFNLISGNPSSIEMMKFISIVADFDISNTTLDELPEVIKDFSEFMDTFNGDIKQVIDTIMLVRKAQEIANDNEK